MASIALFPPVPQADGIPDPRPEGEAPFAQRRVNVRPADAAILPPAAREASLRQPRSPLRLPDWRSMRPAAETYLPGEGCKWPDIACPHPRLAGRPYCRAHHDRAYLAIETD